MSMEQRIVESINNYCGKEVTVERVSVPKNNGVIREGFTIKEVGSTLAPTIYFNPNDSENTIVERVVGTYREELKRGTFPNMYSQDLYNHDVALAKVIPCLVNEEKNKMIPDLVTFHYEADMMFIFKVDVGEGFVTVKERHLPYLNLTVNEIVDAALKNIEGKGVLKMMGDVLADAKDKPLIVLTNEFNSSGAGAILDSKVIEKLNEIGDCYVIPSSIHEMIIVPKESMKDASDEDNKRALTAMLRAINREAVSVEDYLSDTLLEFVDGKIRKVEV